MVTFVCEVCQDSVKKPKLDQHRGRCPRAYFSCVDCSQTFQVIGIFFLIQGSTYKAHTSCFTEDEKYQKTVYNGKKVVKGGELNGRMEMGSAWLTQKVAQTM